MRFEVTTHQEDRNFEVVYRMKDRALASSPHQAASGCSLAFNEVQLELSESGNAAYVWGYCPKESWQTSDLDPPSASPGELRIIPDTKLTPGVSLRSSKTRLPIYYNERSRWLCLGNPSAREGFRLQVAPCLIAVGTPIQIDALWIRLARFDP
jgi:hypothetical protein